MRVGRRQVFRQSSGNHLGKI